MEPKPIPTSAWMAPEYSEWECHLFGSTPENPGMVWHPSKGYAPSLFVRLMVRAFFDCRWIKRPPGGV